MTDHAAIIRRLRVVQSDADGDFWPLAEDAADAIEALDLELADMRIKQRIDEDAAIRDRAKIEALVRERDAQRVELAAAHHEDPLKRQTRSEAISHALGIECQSTTRQVAAIDAIRARVAKLEAELREERTRRDP